MHSKLNLRECHFYKSKSHCPFEELGCKFGHGRNMKVKDTNEKINDTNKTVDEQYSYSEDISNEIPTNPICTSTPIKNQTHLLKCEDCLNLSQCRACRIIQQIEERHEIKHEGRQVMKKDILI